MNYRPLPESLTIKPSSIEGLGLFAVKTIPKNTDLGMIHFSYGELIIRTPLGGFINHSEDPNVELIEDDNDDYKRLKTLRKIESGEELALKYSLYDICDYL